MEKRTRRRQVPKRGRGKNAERVLEPKATEDLGLALRVLQELVLRKCAVWVGLRRGGNQGSRRRVSEQRAPRDKGCTQLEAREVVT